MFHEITVSPFRTNALELVGRDDLVTRIGQKVIVDRSGMDFIISIGTRIYATDDNINASAILNQNETGFIA
jgi:hypothetical protein